MERNVNFWQQIEQDISRHMGRSFLIKEKQGVSGGDINQAYRLSDGKTSFFIKINRRQLAFMFEAEAKALQEISQTASIRVPEPIATGVYGQEGYLILSWLRLSSSPKADVFGRQMAQLHRTTRPRFGFYLDNTIGSTPQINGWADSWVDFWQTRRLGFQLDLCHHNGYGGGLYDQGQRLIAEIPLFFEGYQPVASLLHGDLWSGNWSGDQDGQPVIFDPASYYGDREADLAMMELFGHPGRAFFAAYNEAYELDAGYAVRKNLYNLYHILNHANLFGSSYAMQAESMIDSLLAEIR